MNVIAEIFSSLIGKSSQESSEKATRIKHRRETLARNQKKVSLDKEALASLNHILANKTLVETGQVKLLGLENIKEKLGKKWPVLKDSIHESLLTITNKVISERDVFFSRSDEEYIIVFATTSHATAELICAKILQQLTEKFTGQVDTAEIIVKTAVHEVNGEVFFQPKSLQVMLDGAGNRNAKEQDSQKSLSGSAENSYDNKAEREEFTFGYCPVWDVNNEVITTYLVNACSNLDETRHHNDKSNKIGYDVLATPDSKDSMIGLDYDVLQDSASTLEDLFLNKFRSIFTIPLCYETVFTTELLVKYAIHCKKVSPSVKKYIIFSLVNFPGGIPTVKLNFIVSTLKKYGSGVLLQTDGQNLHIEKYQDCGIKVFSIDIVTYIHSTKGGWNSLTSFILNCHKNKIQVMLLNVDSLDDLILAKEAGADYISGRTIGDYKDTSDHMLRVPWKTLLSNA